MDKIIKYCLLILLFVSLFGTWGRGFEEPFLLQLVASSPLKFAQDLRITIFVQNLKHILLLVVIFNSFIVCIHKSTLSKKSNIIGIVLAAVVLLLSFYMAMISYAFSGGNNLDRLMSLGYGPPLAILSLILLIVTFAFSIKLAKTTTLNDSSNGKPFTIPVILLNLLFISYVIFNIWNQYKPYNPSPDSRVITSTACQTAFSYPSDWTAEVTDTQYCDFTFQFKNQNRNFFFFIVNDGQNWEQVLSKYSNVKPTKSGQVEVLITPKQPGDYANQVFFYNGTNVFSTEYDFTQSDPQQKELLFRIISSLKTI